MKNNSETIFADLCKHTYLSGFTFHSPKIYDPTEKEVGDIIIWVRTQLFVFEIIWRAKKNADTKSFVKRIGDKREQLNRDYRIFKSGKELSMINKSGRKIHYKSEYFVSDNFFGLIIIDCDDHLEKIHFGTIEKFLNSPFPIAVATKHDFENILNEVDTTSDLKFYLHDRFKFFQAVYKKCANYFLDLNQLREKQLIAYYKLNNYSFPEQQWNPDRDYWSAFQKQFSSNIKQRNRENEDSKIIDSLIDVILENDEEDISLVHAWQLAVIPRRSRAGELTNKIKDALYKMKYGKRYRHFAVRNEMTNCWLVFYFQYGGDLQNLIEKLEYLTKLKLFFEIEENRFSYSVIGYGFRKSEIVTQNMFDDIALTIEDAKKYENIPEKLIIEAKKSDIG